MYTINVLDICPCSFLQVVVTMWNASETSVIVEDYCDMVPETVLPKIILLVEDHMIFGKIMQRTIESHTPHQVVHLFDGAELLEKIDEYKPDLLVLDYELPGKNGIELYDLVHATCGCENIPTLIISAELPQQQMAQRHLNGLSKPCSTKELLQMVEASFA
jgi:CheY-like chemotaxis protein